MDKEKAKAYDEALIVAKQWYNDSDTTKKEKYLLKGMFSELTESEDERIRKWIIGVLSTYEHDKDLRNAAISWLEKQGNFMSALQEANKKIGELVEENYYLKEQGEQKPTDKVEPKFHEGDWVVDKNGIVKQILSYKNGVYKHTDGYSAKIFEDEWRLWDITKDAKAGDVLVDSLGNVCIYQEPSTKLMYHSYCYGSHKCFIDAGGSHEIVGSSPATKEQRDLLFQKMKEAGYEWDAAKLELRKIEQIEQKSVEWTMDNIEELTEFENAMMHIGGSFFGQHAGLDPNDTNAIKEQANVLLGLVSSKEWSEEDEKILDGVITNYESGYLPSVEKRDEIIKKLESFKERHTWKPSDEQMKVLQWCMPLWVEPKSKAILESLINDLNKLREE